MSARADTGRRCPQSGGGEDFLARWPFFFFYENRRNAEMKNKKIDPKVQNGLSFRGLQTGR